jgi:hypothetical protein
MRLADHSHWEARLPSLLSLSMDEVSKFPQGCKLMGDDLSSIPHPWGNFQKVASLRTLSSLPRVVRKLLNFHHVRKLCLVYEETEGKCYSQAGHL